MNDLNINPDPIPNVDPVLKQTLQRNLLKYAAGRAIVSAPTPNKP